MTTIPARDGFGQVVRAEWTKLRSVRSTAWCLAIAVGLTVLLSVLLASGSSTDANEGPDYVDRFSFLHRPLSGDGTITGHLRTQRDSHEWAKAGLIIKQGTESGAPFAAVMVTPRHGVRMQANFDTELGGSPDTAPRWLRLTRTGETVTGYESADGTTWTPVGTVTLGGLPPAVEVGLFVTSPPNTVIERGPGSTTVTGVPTAGEAVFDQVSVTGPATPWSHLDVAAARPADMLPDPNPPAAGTATEAAGTFTLTGSGEIAPVPPGGNDDVVQNSLAGVLIGLIAIITLGVLFATSEYKTGVIRTTLAASPRRGRVLVAKALVLGGVSLAAGLVAIFASFLLAQPLLRANGYQPPAYPYPSLTDGTVLRALVGGAGFLALLALFGLGIGALLRRTAGAITLAIALVLLPQIIAPLLSSVSAAKWVQRVTPAAGLAISQTRERYDSPIAPWAGFGVLCAFTALALGLAVWQIRRRDA